MAPFFFFNEDGATGTTETHISWLCPYVSLKNNLISLSSKSMSSSYMVHGKQHSYKEGSELF